jgi:hypothetical protein
MQPCDYTAGTKVGQRNLRHRAGTCRLGFSAHFDAMTYTDGIGLNKLANRALGLIDAFDLRAKLSQLFIDALIATVDLAYIANTRGPAGGQSRQR